MTEKGEGQLRPREGKCGPFKPERRQQGLSLVHFTPQPTLIALGYFWLFMEDGVDEGKIAWAGWGQETKVSGCHAKEFGSHLLSIQDSSKGKDKDVFSRKDASAAERD